MNSTARFLSAALLLTTLQATAQTESLTLTAAERLQACTRQLPLEPLDLHGTLRLRSYRGIVQSEADFTLKFRWGQNPQRIELELRQSETANLLERAVLTRDTTCSQTTIRRYSSDGKQLPAPNPNATIAGTDLTWMDLSLDFLWWKDVAYDTTPDIEREVMGRTCAVLIVKPPVNYPGYGSARLWLDLKTGFLLRAEHLAPNGIPIRRMWVQKVGKTNGKWMVRDMEIKSPTTNNRTMLWIDSLTTPAHE
ncbi:MAG: outer membrane lipoprotein-sorting protein [Kiritimatiellia bacterium]